MILSQRKGSSSARNTCRTQAAFQWKYRRAPIDLRPARNADFQPVSIVVTGYLVQKDLDGKCGRSAGSDHAHVTAAAHSETGAVHPDWTCVEGRRVGCTGDRSQSSTECHYPEKTSNAWSKP